MDWRSIRLKSQMAGVAGSEPSTDLGKCSDLEEKTEGLERHFEAPTEISLSAADPSSVVLGDIAWSTIKTQVVVFSTLDHVVGIPAGFALALVYQFHISELEIICVETGAVAASILYDEEQALYWDKFLIPSSGKFYHMNGDILKIDLHAMTAVCAVSGSKLSRGVGILHPGVGLFVSPRTLLEIYMISPVSGKEVCFDPSEIEAVVPDEDERTAGKPLVTKVNKTYTESLIGVSVFKEQIVHCGRYSQFTVLQDGRVAAWADYGECFGGFTVWDPSTNKTRFVADNFILDGNPKVEGAERIVPDEAGSRGTLQQVGPSLVALFLQRHKFGIVIIDVDRMEQVGLAAEGERIQLAEVVQVEGQDHCMLIAGTVAPGTVQVWKPVTAKEGWYKKQQEVEIGEKVKGITALQVVPGGKLLAAGRVDGFGHRPIKEHPIVCLQLNGVDVSLPEGTGKEDRSTGDSKLLAKLKEGGYMK